VLLLPSTTDLYFPMADIVAESRLIPGARVAPIRTVWGHAAGAGCDWCDARDTRFLNREIANFLAAASSRSSR
jgi:homoserine O-acetyltransferase